MHRVGSLLQFVGGALTRVAMSGILFGIFTVLVGVTPPQYAALIFTHPPTWLPWASPGLVLLGIVAIWASITFNVWSQKQKAIDALAEDMSDAIRDLVNANPVPQTPVEIKKWEESFHAWCAQVSKKLENRAFFTRADQLHFDRLGYVDPITMHGVQRLNWLHSQLKLKFERLRDVINWTQARRH